MPQNPYTLTDTLPIKVWYAAVSAQCGEPTAYQLELLLRNQSSYAVTKKATLTAGGLLNDGWRIYINQVEFT